MHAAASNKVHHQLQVCKLAAANALPRAHAEDRYRQATSAPWRPMPEVAVILMHKLRPFTCKTQV